MKHPTCHCPGCPECTDERQRCARRSTDADHVVAGDDHSDANLQGLCHPCHVRKTITEREANRPQRRRPTPPHPGLIQGAP